MFIIAGRFLAKYDYYNDVKSQQEITELTLHYKMASFVVMMVSSVCTKMSIVHICAADLWQENEECLLFATD
jgi:hypothetical protein